MCRQKKILILGATGMLGQALFRSFSQDDKLDVYATARNDNGLNKWFPPQLLRKIIVGVNFENFDAAARELEKIQPDTVINCVGLIKQQPIADEPLAAITINAQLPHRIALVCRGINARVIHMSTDCVFNGKTGGYKESDASNAADLYGRTKYLGELAYQHCVTFRTSIIGHELKGRYGLLEWFLSQDKKVKGFCKAIFSGFPTVELARIIHDYVLPNHELSGIYHVSSEPISKYDLLQKVAQRYEKKIEIEPDHAFIVDRSLDSTVFCKATNYVPPSWDKLIEMMHKDFIINRCFYSAE